jgi:hypothetical protein
MLGCTTSGAADRVFDRLVAGLEIEFGSAAAEGLARIFIEAEGAEFYWEAREKQRWLGGYESLEEEGGEWLDRVAVTGFLGGQFYLAVLVVDGFGAVQALLGVRRFADRIAAEGALAKAH